MVFVTTGTQSRFPRLIQMVSSISKDTEEDFVIQNGEVLQYDEYIKLFKEARVVIAHAGIGTLLDALHLSKPLIVVPRIAEQGEKINNHQVYTAYYIKKEQLAYVANSESELRSLLASDLKGHHHQNKDTTLKDTICKLIDGEKILAVCSDGGHTMELREILTDTKCVWVTTSKGSNYVIDNFSRKTIGKSIKTFFRLCSIIYRVSPKVVISSGAAPGFIAIMVAKLMRKKTIWIDSLACVGYVSLSGRLAKPFSDYFFTQWRQNARGSIQYIGSII